MAKTEEIRYVCQFCKYEHRFKDGIMEHMKGHVKIKIISSEFEIDSAKSREEKDK